MEQDTKQLIQAIRTQSGRPLYRSILKIQNRALSGIEKISWVRCVEVSVDRSSGAGMANNTELRYVRPDRYIAVSCPWDISSPDDAITEKYHIDPDAGMHEITMPQDAVLDRVIKYADAHRLPFWIDKLCIDQQEGSSEKRVAIQSMDLVYENSVYTVGLLFIRLDAKKHVDRLRELLFHDCVGWRHDKNGFGGYELNISPQDAREIINAIELVLKDTWWERGWIFQEEYLSTTRMRLLIRSSQYKASLDKFGNIPGELELDAVDFRKAVTRFCLAVRRRADTDLTYRNRCANILQKAGRYSLLLIRDEYEKNLKSMSPTILREIAMRNITDIADILAIAANSCGYSERLDFKKLKGSTMSLSLAILTLYLLNGEILSPRSRTRSILIHGNVFKFLNDNALPIEPPLGLKERGLTFAKHCRYSNVTLHRKGIKTQGIIWKLSKLIDPRDHRPDHILPKHIYKKIEAHSRWDPPRRKYLDFYEYEALWKLHHVITRHKQLARHLSHFLDNIAPQGYDEDWTWEHIMYVMAISVARAFQDGKRLRLGSIWCGEQYSPYSAIFIEAGIDERSSDDYFAFTSWARATESKLGDLLVNKSSSKYVSVKIATVQKGPGLAKVKPRRWINGLCFFENADAQNVIIGWPRYFLDI